MILTEDQVWKNLDPDDMWIYDKLILSKKLGYQCGPVGIDVYSPGWYIVRPVINLFGLGYGAEKVWIDKDSDDLPIGYFWCEWFEGRHLSVDYSFGKQILCVEGFKEPDELMFWESWEKTEDIVPLPEILKPLAEKQEILNCEYIGGNLIECQLRNNPDFQYDNSVFIPVWENQNTKPPKGYTYIESPELHSRIGAFIK